MIRSTLFCSSFSPSGKSRFRSSPPCAPQRRRSRILTSNRTREIHDAVKRRCFYHWVDFPDAAREAEIIRRRRPEVEAELAAEIASFARALRGLDLFKIPGVAETIDWAQALTRLGARRLSDESIAATLGALLKYQDDMARVESEIAPLREKAQSGGESKK